MGSCNQLRYIDLLIGIARAVPSVHRHGIPTPDGEGDAALGCLTLCHMPPQTQ
jgi:hypothetical protein